MTIIQCQITGNLALFDNKIVMSLCGAETMPTTHCMLYYLKSTLDMVSHVLIMNIKYNSP